MILLAFAMIGFFFLFLGAVAFVVCLCIPPLRRISLSVALWFAMWGPCTIGLLCVAGLTLLAGSMVPHGPSLLLGAPRFLATLGWVSLAVGTFITVVIATAAAVVHQFVIRRLPFALFRIYATIVAAGIGSVFGWSLCWTLMARGVAHLEVISLLGLATLVLVFGVLAFRGAKHLHGERVSPTVLDSSPEEFAA